SSVTAAAMLRTWSGTTCPGLPRVLSVSELFVNASLFSADSARSALSVLPVKSGDVWMLVEQPIKKARRHLYCANRSLMGSWIITVLN
ncbi:MAG TPA: hypothetical protein VK555_11865, partial [Terriglobales bacterium]|nr:hypothetical protein [Terriglobales bacterium]